MKDKLIPYEPLHAMWIIENMIREEDFQLSKMPELEEYVFKWKEDGPAYTLAIKDEIILCGGVMLIGWQRGEAWTLFAKNFRKYPISCFKACKWVIAEAIREHKLRRVQAVIEPCIDRAREFIERLGFTQEGTLRRFGPEGEDFAMYAKIVEEF